MMHLHVASSLMGPSYRKNKKVVEKQYKMLLEKLFTYFICMSLVTIYFPSEMYKKNDTQLAQMSLQTMVENRSKRNTSRYAFKNIEPAWQIGPTCNIYENRFLSLHRFGVTKNFDT